MARGLALVSMFDAHAFDAWVRPSARGSIAFALTRIVATFALPAFLLLAGVGVALALGNTPEARATVKRRLTRRGVEMTLLGYALSIALAILEGAKSIEVFLRADVLQAIGLSILLTVALDARRRPVVAAGVLVAAACPFVSAWAMSANLSAARFVVAPFVATPGVGPMPLVPLYAWFAGGVALAPMISRAPARIATVGTACVVVGLAATFVAKVVWPGVVTRAHPAIYGNIVDLFGRALLLVAAGHLIASRTERVARVLALLGRTTLVLYVAHLPVTYGIFARPLRRSLDVAEASAWFVALLVAASLVAHGRRRWEQRRRPTRGGSPDSAGTRVESSHASRRRASSA